MPYQYDVFFSYRRDPENNDWHKRVKDKLIHHLKFELNSEEVVAFFDTEEIKSGERWRKKIQLALQSSKCIVCIWSPRYFNSKWCVSEWLTFERRSETCGVDLICPARYHDGQHYPGTARDRQSPDFSGYTSTLPRFWDTERAVEFERNYLMPFARDLAGIITAAPQFNPNFPIVEAPDDVVAQDKHIGRVADDKH
jgi:hypothetical protein